MAKHRKKQSQHSRDKLADAQRRNQFFYKLNYLINAVTGDPSVFKLIPENEYKIIYIMHFNAPRVLAEPGSIINPKLVEMIRHLIFLKLKTNTTTYTPKGPTITCDMFLTVGMTLYSYLIVLDENRYPTAKELKKRLTMVTKEDKENDTDIIGTLISMMSDPIETIPTLINNFEDQVYWITLYAEMNETNLKPLPYYQFTIHMYRPKKMYVVVDGITRPAYEVCWGGRIEGLIKVEISQKNLRIRADNYPETIPVFIQAHALNRLFERIDCIDASLLQLCLFDSLIDFSYSKGDHNTLLVPFRIAGKKPGYLLASVQQGVLLVHTFLLTTHNGTPEGNRLASLTKLNKLDMQYLTIDKLSAFYASDIADNPGVKKLFIDAGCTDLFDINPPLLLKGTIEQKKPLAEKIQAYLNFTTTDNDLEIYRKEQMPG